MYGLVNRWLSIRAYHRSILSDLIDTPDTNEASKPQRSKWWIPEGYYLSRVQWAARHTSRISDKVFIKVKLEDPKLPIFYMHPDYSYKWLWIRAGHSEFSPPPCDPSWLDGLPLEIRVVDRVHDDIIYSTVRDGRLPEDE